MTTLLANRVHDPAISKWSQTSASMSVAPGQGPVDADYVEALADWLVHLRQAQTAVTCRTPSSAEIFQVNEVVSSRTPESIYSTKQIPVLVRHGEIATAKPRSVGRVAPKKNWVAAANALNRWERLLDGWDGEGSIAPSRYQLEAAKRFVDLMEIVGVSSPMRSISRDGEFGFRWHSERGFASVSFIPDGTMIAYCRDNRSSKVVEFEQSSEEGLLRTDLAYALKEIF